MSCEFQPNLTDIQTDLKYMFDKIKLMESWKE
jgi:hypothetical protein